MDPILGPISVNWLLIQICSHIKYLNLRIVWTRVVTACRNTFVNITQHVRIVTTHFHPNVQLYFGQTGLIQCVCDRSITANVGHLRCEHRRRCGKIFLLNPVQNLCFIFGVSFLQWNKRVSGTYIQHSYFEITWMWQLRPITADNIHSQ